MKDMQDRYGRTDTGVAIEVPEGWQLLPLGYVVPNKHRECNLSGDWLAPRRCHSTMTPIFACIWGYAYAYAIPADQQIVPADATHSEEIPIHNEFWGHFMYNATYFWRIRKDEVHRWNGDSWQPATATVARLKAL